MTEIQYTAYLKGSLKLSKNGEWWHNGKPFTNSRLNDFFLRSIVWDETANEFFVQIGNQRATFTLEDTAYFVLLLDDQSTPWKILISDNTHEELDLQTLTSGNESQIYCKIKSGKFLARFSRSAHQVLIEHAIDENSIESGGKIFKIQSARG